MECCTFNEGSSYPWEVTDISMKHCDWYATTIQKMVSASPVKEVCLNRLQVDKKKYPAVQQNAAKVKDKEHLLPKPIVLEVEINGHLTWALVDCGSLGDFVSSTLVDQLKLHQRILSDPVGLQLAI